MLEKDTKKRLSAAEVLSHPWFEENKCKHDEDLEFGTTNEILDSLK
jgi:serine/threonine protein kinase